MNKKTVLIVDDDPDLRIFLKKIIENLGHQVLLSANTEDAFSIVLDYVPHIIYLDINLDEEYGFALLDKMRIAGLIGKIPIIMITSQKNKKSVMISKDFNVSGYLIKPLSNKSILASMKKGFNETTVSPYTFSDDDHFEKKLQIEVDGNVIKFNEITFSLRSKVKFNDKEIIEISSTFFESLKIPMNHLKVYQASHNFQPGIYDTVVQFIGLTEKHLQSIRSVQTRKV